MAAVPSIGRAARVEGAPAPEADLTRALYEQYGNQIFRYCLHQLGSREEAEDAVQSTFLNAFRGIKRGVVPELESAWLFKIAHNVCLSRRRTSWRRGRIESPTDFDVVEEMTPAPSRRADELIGLQDVLEQMPENQRRAILLREWQGLSYREIAEELELSQAAVETLIFRARRSLAAGLEQPPEPRKRTLVRGADLGNILAGIKALLVGGGAAVKVAATVAVVSASTVVAAAPVQQHHARSHQPPTSSAPQAAAPQTPGSRSSAPPGSAGSVTRPAASFPRIAAKHGAGAGSRARLQLSRLGFASSGTVSTPNVSTPAAEPAAPVAAAPVVAEPAPAAPTAPPVSEPAAQAAVAQAAQSQGPQIGSSSKGHGSAKGNDEAGHKGGTAPAGATAPVVAPPATAIQPVTPSLSGKSEDRTKGASDSKGSDSRGSDSRGSDSKKSSAPIVMAPAVTLSVQPTTPSVADVRTFTVSIHEGAGRSPDNEKGDNH